MVVTISGDGLEIVGTTGKGPNETARPNKSATKPGNADDQALYKSFLKAVNRSRGGIKKCYQRALKADSSLQARTISMKIKVKYNVAGQVTGTGFSPRISSKFDSCMSSITKRWETACATSSGVFSRAGDVDAAVRHSQHSQQGGGGLHARKPGTRD